MIIYDEEPRPLTIEEYAQVAVIGGRYTREQVEQKITELEAANHAEMNTGIWVAARKSYIEDLRRMLSGR